MNSWSRSDPKLGLCGATLTIRAQWSDPARACLQKLAEGRSAWAIPWPCIHEFLAIVTHPRIYTPPSTTEQAIDQIDAWMESPTLTVLGAH